jgi:hypothetical protein
MRRPCLSCGTPTDKTRCPSCARGATRAREQGRPTRQARGYDRFHDRARRALRATLPAPCGYGCGTWLEPDGSWVAAHRVDGDPTAGWLASCRSCNEQAKRRR